MIYSPGNQEIQSVEKKTHELYSFCIFEVGINHMKSTNFKCKKKNSCLKSSITSQESLSQKLIEQLQM